MYLAMDDFGDDNLEKLRAMGEPGEKWKLVADCARKYGLTGIQITPWLYEQQLGLNLDKIPGHLSDFRLSYHIGGVRPLVTDQDWGIYSHKLSVGLARAEAFGFEDVSFHPPRLVAAARHRSELQLRRLVETWLPRFDTQRVSLSLETHVTGEIFILDGLDHYRTFVGDYPELGVLIDVSHNYYDGYSVEDIVDMIAGLNITGLHLSDSLPETEFHQGTHLPVGQGKVDFFQLLAHFGQYDIYGALEINGASTEISESIAKLRPLLSTI